MSVGGGGGVATERDNKILNVGGQLLVLPNEYPY